MSNGKNHMADTRVFVQTAFERAVFAGALPLIAASKLSMFAALALVHSALCTERRIGRFNGAGNKG